MRGDCVGNIGDDCVRRLCVGSGDGCAAHQDEIVLKSGGFEHRIGLDGYGCSTVAVGVIQMFDERLEFLSCWRWDYAMATW